MQNQTEKYESAPSRHLPPIPASYVPSRAIAKIPGNSSIEEILEILERDGVVIVKDFVSSDVCDKIDEDLEPYQKQAIAESDSYDNFIGRKTLVIAGLVSKSDTVANILDTNETIERLLRIILEARYPAVYEHQIEDTVVEPLLSIAMAFYVSHDSPRQALHRDDMIFHSKHKRDMPLNENDGFSCFIAGSNITRETGGTMMIPGSHKWEQERAGRPDEVCFLEMERGSACLFVSSIAHGAGFNTVPGFVRKIINLVFCRGTLRTEENQFLCNPRSKVLEMSPKMQSLLGFKKPSGNWLGLVENEDPTKNLAAVYEKMLA
ncbi:hypothetical protein EJ05DRAFT_2553 [Pseudovirgaria hyperparasitica]|uniref:Phytanoyl-CoA dioxygenase n=1 Tax=Pseudovirgaria hyperparasitica TaxID=470096 RepID=A0A6A6WK05_9PEZI|nr:uncharacterized protein EJ05DRAFT_2553 [Pseudovirgaria hyperparasitica]KAF2762467.1 hypothetical protein EJ05DRAFT_2553 [Pseudovirgaria hyperparasitica]